MQPIDPHMTALLVVDAQGAQLYQAQARLEGQQLGIGDVTLAGVRAAREM